MEAKAVKYLVNNCNCGLKVEVSFHTLLDEILNRPNNFRKIDFFLLIIEIKYYFIIINKKTKKNLKAKTIVVGHHRWYHCISEEILKIPMEPTIFSTDFPFLLLR